MSVFVFNLSLFVFISRSCRTNPVDLTLSPQTVNDNNWNRVLVHLITESKIGSPFKRYVAPNPEPPDPKPLISSKPETPNPKTLNPHPDKLEVLGPGPRAQAVAHRARVARRCSGRADRPRSSLTVAPGFRVSGFRGSGFKFRGSLAALG